jgi:hypothetical protein
MKGWLGALKEMSDGASPLWEPVAKFYNSPVCVQDMGSRSYNTNSSAAAKMVRTERRGTGAQLVRYSYPSHCNTLTQARPSAAQLCASVLPRCGCE